MQIVCKDRFYSVYAEFQDTSWHKYTFLIITFNHVVKVKFPINMYMCITREKFLSLNINIRQRCRYVHQFFSMQILFHLSTYIYQMYIFLTSHNFVSWNECWVMHLGLMDIKMYKFAVIKLSSTFPIKCCNWGVAQLRGVNERATKTSISAYIFRFTFVHIWIRMHCINLTQLKIL